MGSGSNRRLLTGSPMAMETEFSLCSCRNLQSVTPLFHVEQSQPDQAKLQKKG